MSLVLVQTTLPDEAAAEQLARHLIDIHLAACVHIHPPVRAVYRWQGQVELASEVPLTIKTTAALFPDVERAIRARHPYELPEVLAVPVSHVSAPYHAWVNSETESP